MVLSLGHGPPGGGCITPLMWLDKAATWALAQELGGSAFVDLIVEGTHTCYLGEPDPPACLGLWLRHVSGVPVAGAGVGGVRGGDDSSILF